MWIWITGVNIKMQIQIQVEAWDSEFLSSSKCHFDIVHGKFQINISVII